MKVTTLMPDQLIHDVNATAGGKNLTESLLIALREWLAQRRLERLHTRVASAPLTFAAGTTAARLRQTNRRHDPR